MTDETKRVYTEVLEVLENVPQEYTDKIPKDILEIFRKERVDNYKIGINKECPLKNENLNKRTLAIIAMLNYKYWCLDKSMKDELYKMYLSNDKKYEEEMREKYKIDYKNKRK